VLHIYTQQGDKCQDKKTRTGQAKEDRQNVKGKTGQAAHDIQHGTGRTGGRTGQADRDR
jgi:hypothetical protein